MDISRIGWGERIAAASGVALFMFMFLPWYGTSAEVKGIPSGLALDAQNGWESFAFIGNLLLFLTAAAAVGVAAVRAMGAMPPGQIVVGAGVLAVLLILFRILNSPTPSDSILPGVGVDADPNIGIFLGLIAALGITLGGWTAIKERGSQAPPGRGNTDP